MIPQFIKFAAELAPAKHKRAFRADLSAWAIGLESAEKKKVEQKLFDMKKKGRSHWVAIARPMLELFYKKAEV